MPQWTTVVTNTSYIAPGSVRSAMEHAAAKSGQPAPLYPVEVDAAARELLLSIPGYDWVIELDILGGMRITVHFKGVDIEADIPF